MNHPSSFFWHRNDASALLVTSPHGGDVYPPAFLQKSRLGAQEIRRSEDMFVSQLFENAPQLGVSFYAATMPRAFIDLNRSADELDPHLIEDPLPLGATPNTMQTRAGLGVVARLVAENMPIYDKKLPLSEVMTRIDEFYLPFHNEIRATLDAMLNQHGFAVLLDAHSMPSPHDSPSGAMLNHALSVLKNTASKTPDIVLGTNHGAAAAPALTHLICDWLCDKGYRVALNKPYAGGFITSHYGQPQNGIHAVQLEIARALYMDEARHERIANFARLQADIDALLVYVAAQLPHLRDELRVTQNADAAQ